MILSKRVQRSPAYDISYPVHSELAPSFSSSQILASTARTTPPRGHGHKHSLSKPITWLNRSSSSTSSRSIPQAAQKPTRISEPKIGSSLDQFSLRRSGPLGSGATIVRTPQEALSGPSKTFELIDEEGVEQEASLHDAAEENECTHLPPPRPSSPPLPPLPDTSDTKDGSSLSANSIPAGGVSLSDDVSSIRLSGSTFPATQHTSSSTMIAHSRVPSRSTPVLPADADVTPPQPPFEAILLSPPPDASGDPSKVIITLETCTTACRTSLRTLVSRPSHLSRYLTSLFSSISETASVYSNVSEAYTGTNGFSSVFRDHLTSSSSLPPSNSIHIFLDRPSTPYIHILSYLRSLPDVPDHPETLPRAVQLTPMSTTRLDSLLELRDEASYLGLTELYKLCLHEIHRVRPPAPPLPTSTAGRRSMLAQGGKIGSVHSIHTVVEQCQSLQQEARPPERHNSLKGKGTGTADANLAIRASGSNTSCESKDIPIWERSSLRQRRDVKYEVGSPPPGWI